MSRDVYVPVEGFPTCSGCGAIVTAPPEPPDGPVTTMSTEPETGIEPRGAMTADQMIEWIDTHPPLPLTPDTHLFMEPCGQAEGTDSCWFCGEPKDRHPLAVREGEA